MSKIQAEMMAAAKLKSKPNETPEEQRRRIVLATQDLSDAAWDGLSTEAKDWFNTAIDDMNAKKAPAPFPDAEPEAPAGRRRATAKVDDEPEGPSDPVKGDKVVVTNARDKTFTGEVIDIDDDTIVLKCDDGEEREFTRDKLKSCTVAPATKAKADAKPARRRDDDDDADEAPATPALAVGSVVSVTNARDKTYKGEVVALDDDTIVLKCDDGEEREFTRAKLKDCTPEVTKAAAKKAAGKAEPKSKPDDDAPAKRTVNKGVSVGQRIRELVVADITATVEDVCASLKKEGLEFREQTVQMTYADTHKVVTLLKEAKKLK